MPVIEKLIGVSRDQRPVIFELRGLLTLLQDADGLHQHLRVIQQIGAHLGPESVPFRIGHFRQIERGRGGGKAGGNGGGQGEAGQHGRYSGSFGILTGPGIDAGAMQWADEAGGRS